MREMTVVDQWLGVVDNALRTAVGALDTSRPTPAGDLPEAELTPQQRRETAALMRVNHVGEVCAQALYQGQAMAARDPALAEGFLKASQEEGDHLTWSAQRLRELDGRISLLTPLWYAGALGIGLVAGRLGDRVSLSFMAETERQVEAHLEGHQQRIPAEDRRTHAILEQMKSDEAGHRDQALATGGVPLPLPVKWLMQGAARVMTTVAHRI